jgi:DNA-binding NtrC family response regulator
LLKQPYKQKMTRILFVDDEAPIRFLLARAFARAGYDVKTAINASQAMVALATQPLLLNP